MLNRVSFILAPCFVLISVGAFAQSAPAGSNYGVPKPASDGAHGPGPQKPLFFRVEWQPVKGLPVEHPLDAKALAANPNLELKLYGPSGKDIQENGTPDSTSNPMHLWTGLCMQVCGMALRDKDNYVDLADMGKIRWLTKIGGLHQVHPILKLADATWILGEHGDGTVFDYHVGDFTLSETRWIALDPVLLVTHGRWLEKVDLSKVDEIGWTDLMPGSGHGDGGYTDMGWIEIYGTPVPRTQK